MFARRAAGTAGSWPFARGRPRPDLPVVYVTGYCADEPRPVPGSIFLTKAYRVT